MCLLLSHSRCLSFLNFQLQGCIFTKVSAVGLDYTHDRKVLSLAAVSGDAIDHAIGHHRSGQYRTWMATLIENTNTSQRYIDVYSIEEINGWCLL